MGKKGQFQIKPFFFSGKGNSLSVASLPAYAVTFLTSFSGLIVLNRVWYFEDDFLS